MAAVTLGMPELRIEPARARRLEDNFMAVLADRGITLTGPGANMNRLIFSIITLYGPMIMALLRRFVFDQGQKNSTGTQQVPTPRQPGAQPPQQTQSQPETTVFTPDFTKPADLTPFNNTGFPETAGHKFPDGSAVVGSFIDTSGLSGLQRI